ncbi:MAG: serine hydrolase domain-containing protein [Actinomycetes bacterium]
MKTPITGFVTDGFERVALEFSKNFSDRGEIGAGVFVMVDHEVVVDLIGGWADEEQARPWASDTLVDFYSVGKAFVGLLALRLIDEGRVGLDDLITKQWPEFGAGGKANATVRHALCHRAGVPAIGEAMTDEDLWNWESMVSGLARTTAWFDPGSRHAYHTNTYGHLVGEIIRRTSGRMPHDLMTELCAELGADVYFGVPDEHLGRCADVVWGGGLGALPHSIEELEGDALMAMKSYFNPPGYSSLGLMNTDRWRSAQIPSTNGHGTAEGVCRIYSALLRPDFVVSQELLAEATAVQSSGYCPILGEDVAFGLGFKPTSIRRPFGPNPRSFGHFGTGGALGFADPDSGVAFGYVMNQVTPRWQSTRNRALIDATCESLGSIVPLVD